MLEKIVKYIPPAIKANKIVRCLYFAFHRTFVYRIINKWGEYFYYRQEGYKLEKFKDIHKGQRCFIIGNGPSILQQDLTKLKDEFVFVTNDFVLHQQYNEINPTYYCVSDMNLFSASDTNTKWSQLMLQKTGNAVKFFPLSSKSFASKRNPFINHQVFYLNYPGIRIWETGLIRLDVTKQVYTGDTVIIDFCLPLAFYMGFSEVYLLGCDCDFKLDEAEDLSKGHFYDVRQTVTRPRPVNEYLMKDWYEHIMVSYSIAKQAFEHHGRKTYNAGIGGKLEVFERVNYDKLFD